MTDKKCIEIVHDMLRQRGRWYIDHSISESDSDTALQEIVEDAKIYADEMLGNMSTFALYQRYRKWRKEDPMVVEGDKYFETFLSHVVQDLGASALSSEDRLVFDDSCSFNVKFISQ